MNKEFVIVDISKCPITGTDRRTELQTFAWNPKVKNLQVVCHTNFIKNGEIVSGPGVGAFQVRLVADNRVIVNAKDGSILEKPDAEENKDVEKIGEYDFFLKAAQSPIDLFKMIEDVIKAADARGRFNNVLDV